jgi:SHS2 domain-containing protein
VKLSYKNLEHTGDIGVEVWGESWEDLLQNCSLALSDTIADLDKIRARQEVVWTLEAESPEELLVKQLQEILYRLDAEGMVFSQFSVHPMGENQIRCVAGGEVLERERHGFKTEIKAVTYHQLKLEKEKGRWKARIIFDV